MNVIFHEFPCELGSLPGRLIRWLQSSDSVGGNRWERSKQGVLYSHLSALRLRFSS